VSEQECTVLAGRSREPADYKRVDGTGIKRQIGLVVNTPTVLRDLRMIPGLLLHEVAIIMYTGVEPSSSVTESTASARLALGPGGSYRPAALGIMADRNVRRCARAELRAMLVELLRTCAARRKPLEFALVKE
jgi:hypothetical protein